MNDCFQKYFNIMYIVFNILHLISLGVRKVAFGVMTVVSGGFRRFGVFRMFLLLIHFITLVMSTLQNEANFNAVT